MVIVVLPFWVLSASSARSAGDIGVSFVQYRLSTLACLFSRRWRRLRRGMQQAALFRRERQIDVCIVFGVIMDSAVIIREICGGYWGCFLVID